MRGVMDDRTPSCAEQHAGAATQRPLHTQPPCCTSAGHGATSCDTSQPPTRRLVRRSRPLALVLALALVLVLAACAPGAMAQYRRRHHGGGGGGGNKPKLDFDPYEALGVAKTAKQAEIRRAFRRLSLQLHPDKNKGDATAQERFNKVTQAYEVLGDADKRAIFDQFGQEEYHSKWEFMQKTGGKGGTGGDFYGPDTNVKPVSSSNFTNPRPKPMLVEFYAPWCVHCQQMTGAWRKAALLLDELVTVGAVNCERQKQLCRRTNIRAYPSVFLYPAGRPDQSPEPFKSEHHTADAIVEFVRDIVTPATVELHAWNFDNMVMRSPKMWVVMYKMPWCGPCKAAMPAVRKLASALEGVMSVGVVDCESDGELCHEQQVRYYPFLKLYPRTDKGSFNDGLGQVLDYDDGSGAAGAMSLLRQVLDVVLVHDLASMGDGDGCGVGGECGAGAGDEFDDEDAFLDELDGEEDL